MSKQPPLFIDMKDIEARIWLMDLIDREGMGNAKDKTYRNYGIQMPPTVNVKILLTNLWMNLKTKSLKNQILRRKIIHRNQILLVNTGSEKMMMKKLEKNIIFPNTQCLINLAVILVQILDPAFPYPTDYLSQKFSAQKVGVLRRGSTTQWIGSGGNMCQAL